MEQDNESERSESLLLSIRVRMMILNQNFYLEKAEGAGFLMVPLEKYFPEYA